MTQNFRQPATPLQQETRSRPVPRLVAALLLIGLAIGGLALIDRFREHPAGLRPPHEPSQALITSPTDASMAPALNAEPTISLPLPPSPQVVNNETLASPDGVRPARPLAVEAMPTGNAANGPGKSFLIQVGVFTSPANAQALQKQLRQAGIDARLETRVQLGPFKDRRAAEKVLVRARKLGINAVMVGSR